MSRIAKKPIQIADKTKVSLENRIITVSGEKGILTRDLHPLINVEIKDKTINVTKKEESKKTKALSGLTWSLINNMVIGVSKGFERSLEINGIGYRAELKGKDKIIFNIGYSNPVEFIIPKGVSAKVDKTKVKLFSIDKELIGHVAASIRKLRPPEPYKGKGIKYAKERIIKKAGKAVASAS